MTDLETIKILSVFDGLGSGDLEKIAKIAKVRRIKAGSVLFKRGASKKDFLVITNGEVEIYKELNSKTQTLAIFKQDQFLNEAAIIGQAEATHAHGAKALEDSEVLIIKNKDWFKTFGNNYKVNNKILENIVKSLRERLFYANNKLVGFFQVSEIIGRYGGNLEKILTKVFKVILEIIPCQKGVLALYQAVNDKIIIKATKGYPITKKVKGLQIPRDEPIMAEILGKKESVIVNLGGEVGAESQYGKNSIMACPIILADKVLGIIVLGDKLSGHDFNLNNQILVEMVGKQLAVAISQAEMIGEREAEEELKRVYVG